MISLRSKVTRKLLNYYFLNPDAALYVNELSAKLGLDKRNLVKKIKELEKEGLMQSRITGNLKFYSINKDFPLYNEYKMIILKTLGFENTLRDILKKMGKVTEAYLYGSYAKNAMDAHSDIDLLVIGNHDLISLQRKISSLQRDINREINVVNMDSDELKKRIKRKDPFICQILRDKHIRLI